MFYEGKLMMEPWRIYALSFFPQLSIDLLDEEYSYYSLFYDVYYVLKLHRHSDALLVEKLYAFAAWCLRQDDDDIVNAVRVGFYEHLFDHKEDWDSSMHWLTSTPQCIPLCWSLWEARLSPADLAELREALL